MYHDRFNKSHAKPKVKKYLTNKFKAVKFKNQSKYLVEKTCANSLRIPFINEIFPDAIYIIILEMDLIQHHQLQYDGDLS